MLPFRSFETSFGHWNLLSDKSLQGSHSAKQVRANCSGGGGTGGAEWLGDGLSSFALALLAQGWEGSGDYREATLPPLSGSKRGQICLRRQGVGGEGGLWRVGLRGQGTVFKHLRGCPMEEREVLLHTAHKRGVSKNTSGAGAVWRGSHREADFCLRHGRSEL